jgi:hypothetical protein
MNAAAAIRAAAQIPNDGKEDSLKHIRLSEMQQGFHLGRT